jgi:hypothetical protein
MIMRWRWLSEYSNWEREQRNSRTVATGAS